MEIDPVQALRQRTSRRPDEVALVVGQRSWSNRELLTQSESLAVGLVARGVSSGDRVSIQMQNAPEIVATYLACAIVGAIAAPLNTRWTAVELAPVLGQLDPVLHVDDPHLDAVVAATGHAVPRFIVGPPDPVGARPFDDLLAASAALPPTEVPTSRHRLLLLLGTSGTMGETKLVVHTRATVSASIDAYRVGILRDTRVALCPLPLVHASGVFHALACVGLGIRLIVPDDQSPGALLDAVETYGPDYFIGVPALYDALVGEQRARPRAIGTLRRCITGGDVCPPEVHHAVAETFGLPVRQQWGCTEVVSVFDCGDQDGSVSLLLPGSSVRMIDRSGDEVRRGEAGELLVRSAGVSPGYWDGPGGLVGEPVDGWFASGDLFRRGEGAQCWFSGRVKDLIVRSGSNISPIEVGDVLRSHPDVAAAVVVGVPDATLGQRVAAVLGLRQGVDPNRAPHVVREVRAAVDERLARYKQPDQVEVVDHIPQTDLGKVDRQAVLELLTRAEK